MGHPSFSLYNLFCPFSAILHLRVARLFDISYWDSFYRIKALHKHLALSITEVFIRIFLVFFPQILVLFEFRLAMFCSAII